MIYVISKSTFGDYGVRDIQCNANWTSCPYSNYARIPDNLVEGILATKGYCNITLNSDGTEVKSFTAKTIPSVPQECCGENAVFSVNGAKANGQGEIRLPRNLLDNSDFSNPVNQRGQTEYYGTTGYSIDRWRAVANIRLTVKNGYVSAKNEGTGYNGFTQYFDTATAPKQGDVYTAACRLHDGTVFCGATTITSAEYNTAFRMDSGTTARFYGPTNRLIFMLAPGDQLDIEWVAVYKGEFTAETLPDYRPKGYVAELAECQRYFRIVQNGNGYAGNSAYIFFPFEFRVTPTATVVSLGSIRTDGSNVTPTEVTAVDQYIGSIRLTFAGTYPSSAQPANLFNANIQLSADL